MQLCIYFSLKTDKREKGTNIEKFSFIIMENIMPCFYVFGSYFVK